jgi:outer membrane receptor protein involved in Fe transport
MNRKLLATAVCAGLLMAASAHAQTSTNTQDQDTSNPSTSSTKSGKKDKTQILSTITVTGSLIPQSQIETANPVITISAEDMTRKGFTSVYDALRSQPLSTGSVQDSTFSAGFTPGAETISLLGLPVDFTLFLINGRPMADYPLLYNGSTSFVNISNIPMSMVDHIDILPGNQSSIYGSSAIAGVVNVVLKKRLQGFDMGYRAGGYSDGGGNSQRLDFSGGINTAKLNVLYSVQVEDQHPMFGYNRKLTASTLSNPNPDARYAIPSVNGYFLDYYLGTDGNYHSYAHYFDPNDYGGCSAMSGLFGGTTKRQSRPNRGATHDDPGYYCGSTEAFGYSTLMNKRKTYSGLVNFTYQINDNAQLFGMLMYSHQKQRFYAGPNYNWWAPDVGNYIYDDSTGTYDYIYKFFSPEEIGGQLANSVNDVSKMYNGNVGVRGNFGDSSWNYEAYYSRADYKVRETYLRPLAEPVEDFFRNMFLGPKLGTYYGYSVYRPDFSKFLKPITPADYRSFTGLIDESGHTYTQNVNLQVTNASLFHLPAGDVGMAVVLQGGNQYWSNPGDPRVIAGDYWGWTGTSGEGKRNNYAAAVEFNVPIFSMLTADVSARYDRYKNVDAGSDSKPTYKLGLEFRPFDSLLLRANYATAFRAPGMASVFQGPSGSYGSVTDYYKCEKYEPTTSLSDCTWDSAQFRAYREGNHNLKSITAHSWGYGVVWSPTDKLTLKADYYDITIKDEISQINIDTLMRTEADCRLGKLDPVSPTCVDAFERIKRSAPNAANPLLSENLQTITSGPINVSNERVKGIVASAAYKVDAGRFGDFTFNGNYNVTLDHFYQQYPNDPSHDLLHEPTWSSEFKSIFTGSVTWDIGKWTTTLSGTRFGSTPNFAAQVYGWEGGTGVHEAAGTLPPWMVYNASVKYQVTPGISARLTIDNLKNSMPPADTTWVGWPYYNQFNYNPWGRSIWLSLDVHFGAK